jgi:hypothetical protein
MRTRFRPEIAEIEAAFQQAIAPYGGVIWDRYGDDERLFVRSVYPHVREFMPGDQFQRGVAIRVTGETIVVHPYLFRQVCQNGAILAWAVDSRRIDRVKSRSTLAQVSMVLTDVGLAVQACSEELVLHQAADRMRLAAEREANVVLQLMPMLSRMPQRLVGDLLDRITSRFEGQRDRSVYGLMNAVTSVARDTRDPDIRWRLEELGGGVPAEPRPKTFRPRGGRARRLVPA